MKQPLPLWLIVVFVLQFLVAVLFGLFGWSMTVSLAKGRPASALDIAALSIPTLAVLVLGAAAVRLWRSGRRAAAVWCAILPFPLAIALFMLLGAI